ncbi:MAG: S-methyl-5'-thioadenosine phosphorylase [Chloroflexota bacterium]
MTHADIGVIGGSGLYDIEGLADAHRVDIATPFGAPSDSIVVGTADSVRVAFLPRHGRGHRLLPSEIPARANIYALKTLGVSHIVSVSAVGSLQENLRPMDMVVPDQIFDRTRARLSTFFGDGMVAHVAFAQPFCARLSDVLAGVSSDVVSRTHQGGTYVCIEGPAFSTYAESVTYRRLEFDIIGMTALPEAKLAREAQICYAVLAQVTDYDCWRRDEESVTSDIVMANVARNVTNARKIIRALIPRLQDDPDCSCRHALEGAVVTDASCVHRATRDRLALLLPETATATP